MISSYAQVSVGELVSQRLARARVFQRLGRGRPRPGAELPVAAVVGELDLEPAEHRRLLEHFGLDVASLVPRRLAAGGGVHGEDQPAALTRRARRRRRGDFLQKGIDLSGIGDGNGGSTDYTRRNRSASASARAAKRRADVVDRYRLLRRHCAAFVRRLRIAVWFDRNRQSR